MARKLAGSRRSSGASTADIMKWVAGVALILVVAAAFGGLFYWQKSSVKPARDLATLCPVTGPKSIHLVLLDATDDLPAAGKQQITTLLTDAITATPVDGLAEVRLLDPRSRGGRTIFSKCNPGDGAGLSEWTANPALAKRRWIESFQKPLQSALEAGMRPAQSETSPLLSTLQMMSIERLSGQSVQALPKSMTVISDLIEHGAKYSQYAGSLSYETFRKSDAYRDYRTDLNGADVTLYQVQRKTRRPISSSDLIRFWIDWVKDNNGYFKEALKVQGLG